MGERNEYRRSGQGLRCIGQNDSALRECGAVAKPAEPMLAIRLYGEKDIRTLQFIRRSRDLGFSIEEIRGLVSLWQDKTRPSREVKAVARQHLDFLDRKLEELQSMKNALSHLVDCCHGDERPDCPILDNLAGAGNLTRM